MTARLDLPDSIGAVAEHAAAASNAGKRDVRAVRDKFAGPDHLMLGLLDQLEAEGRVLAPSPRMRAYLRELQKAIEGRS
jgi:hypothetical protein